MTGPAAAVAAPHAPAVEAAQEAWRRGANAVDLAVAAATTLVVTYPHQCALGGDLVALVREPGGRVHAVVSVGAAPEHIDAAGLRERGEGMPRGGPDSVTVPGILAGWEALIARGGRVPLADHLRLAADLAAAGTPVAAGLVRAIERRRTVVAADPGLSELFMPGGEPLSVGAPLVQPRLAESLRAIADEGPAAFYGGEVGARLAAGLQRLGSRMSVEDLEAHAVDVADPLSGEAYGARWAVSPPPSQGVTLLGLLLALDAGEGPLGAVRSRAAARDALLGDPRRERIDVDALLSGALPSRAAGAARAAGDTVAVVAADVEGRVVTLIQSIFQQFGAGILEPETGIVLQNRGGAFRLERAHPGRLEAGVRPPHTLCPAIVETRGGAVVAAGCQGGRAQPQILGQLAQVLSAEDSDLVAALARPRWVTGARDMDRDRETVLAEPGVKAPADEADAAGIPVDRLPGPSDLAGHVQVARVAGDELAAASDPRADGLALVLGTDGGP